MPLDALVSLVMTFNIGIIVERLGGIDTGPPRAARLDRRMAVEELTHRCDARADAGALPGRDGLRRARRRAASSTRSTATGEPTILLLPDLVDHPLALLEDADSRTSRATAGSSPSTARQRALGPARRSPRPTPRRSSRPTRSRCWTRPAPSARASSRSRWARSGRCSSPRTIPSASRASSSSRPALPLGAPTPAQPRRRLVRRASSRPHEGWAKYNRHYWLERLPRTSSSSSSRRCSPSRTRPSRSRTASAGGSRRRRDARRDAGRARRSTTPTSAARAGRARALPGARHPRRRRRDPAARRGAALAELTGGTLVTLEGSGHAPHARDPVKVNLLLRDFVAARRAPRAAGCAGTVARQARALHLLADRARARAARRRRSPRSCASSIPTSRSTGSRSTRSRRCSRRAASASIPASAHLANESRPHRVRVGRARPALLPGHAPDGRDPARQLHGLPRPRRATSSTTSGSATRPGSSTTTCTRTPSRSAPRTSG